MAGETRDTTDDYYAVLGVEPTADETVLRQAWRALVLRWHPDHAGPDTTFIFQKLSAAYAVLSDPVARCSYDRRRATPGSSGPGPVATAAPTSSAAQARAPGVMIWRLSGPLNALMACGIARRAAGDAIELVLTAEEATTGGMVTIAMRVPIRCPACSADEDRASDEACATCGGARTVEDLFSAWLAIRPGATDGTILTPSALLPGMLRPVTFRARLRDAGE